jgi:hypothetical protein
MRTTLAILVAAGCAAALPAVPLPTEKQPFYRDELFGSRGVVTRAELDQLPFDDSVTANSETDEGPSLGTIALRVHLPRTVFSVGEPIPCYFLVRNRTDQAVGLDMRLDLSGPEPEHRNSCSIQVRDLRTGKGVPFLARHCWACGGRSGIELKANGYYCTRGDLSRTADGFLPPGRYEVSWTYFSRHSGAAYFMVKGAAVERKPMPRSSIAFLEVTRAGAREGGEVVDERAPAVWDKVELRPRQADDIAAALALGHEGRYYPDIRELPSRDEMAHVTARWEFKETGDRLKVTIHPNDPNLAVGLAGRPQLLLHVEGMGPADRERMADEKDKQLEALRQVKLPHTVDVSLPKGWRLAIPFGGKVRVAVIVTTRAIEAPGRGLVKEVVKEVHAGGPVWLGLLRTEFQEIEVPARGPR